MYVCMYVSRWLSDSRDHIRVALSESPFEITVRFVSMSTRFIDKVSIDKVLVGREFRKENKSDCMDSQRIHRSDPVRIDHWSSLTGQNRYICYIFNISRIPLFLLCVTYAFLLADDGLRSTEARVRGEAIAIWMNKANTTSDALYIIFPMHCSVSATFLPSRRWVYLSVCLSV